VPELPDITIYLEALEKRILNQSLTRVRIGSPFLLRTAVPPIQNVENRRVVALRRLGKRIVFGFEDDLWLVLHLMIAGRLHWHEAASPPGRGSAADQPPAATTSENFGSRGRSPHQFKIRKSKLGKNVLAVFYFSSGTLTLTEAGTKKRASLHLVQGETSLLLHDPGGLDVLGCTLREFGATLTLRNHTLKRALADPRLFSGIGNAYSDEILHRARLSPVALTQKLPAEVIKRLFHATQQTLAHWIEILRHEAGDSFPENVTAFRPDMAVHGKFGRACPVCGTKVQRIRYADNETNYCPGCQTDGKLLADRSLSLLLRKDWPKTPEELDELRSSKAYG
jgi:formamidopyrimidine-DNA glycosylase